MNGPQHYAAAQEALRLAGDETNRPEAALLLQTAQVHATLALVAATVTLTADWAEVKA